MKKNLHLTLVVFLTTIFHFSAQVNGAELTDGTSAKQPTVLTRSSQQGVVDSLPTLNDFYNTLSSHLTITIKDEYSVGVDNYIVSVPSETEKKAADYFKLDVTSSLFDKSEIHFGLFTIQDEPVFLRELKSDASGSSYSIPSGTTNGEYIIQPYVIKGDGTKQVLTREANSYFIDKLRIVVNTPSKILTRSGFVDVNSDVSASRHMRITSLEKGHYTVNKGDVFTVYVSAGQGTTRIGLFNRNNGAFVSDIVTRSYGDQYTCVVPSSIKDGSYIMMPYRNEAGIITIVERTFGTNVVDRLPLEVRTQTIGELEDHLEIDLATTNNLYKIESGKRFLVKAKATNIQGQVRIGLFEATTGATFIQDITGSYKGDGLYECSFPAYLGSGRCIIEPYIINSDGVMVIVTRPEKSNLIDKLPVTIYPDPTAARRSALVYDLSDIGATNNMRLTTEQECRNIVARGEIFTVYATAGQGTSKVGLFDRATGTFVSDIVISSYGDVYTCQVPKTVAYGDYVVMPYRYQNNVLKVIERKPGLNSVDRLPIEVKSDLTANLIQHLRIDQTTTNNLYCVSNDQLFTVEAITDGDPQNVRIGLFERTEEQKLLSNITSSYQGNNRYECSVPNYIGNGNYILQAYLEEDGEIISLINRQSGDIWIDRLPLAVYNSTRSTRSPYSPSANLTTTRHMRFIMPQDNFYTVSNTDVFLVYVAAGQGTSRVGFFTMDTGEFVGDIVRSPYGDTYTCQIPSTLSLPEGEYLVMAYRRENDSIRVIERPANSNLIDRLPINVAQARFSSRSIVDQTNTDATIKVYPNPVVDMLYIKDLSGTAKMEIYNLSGNLVKSTCVNSDEGVDVQSLPLGIYAVKITMPSGEIITSKIKKN